MMSCLHHTNAKQTMMTWCSCNANTNAIMSPHSCGMNGTQNANDVMMMCHASHVNLVTSHLACASHACMNGACAQNKYGASKYPSGLACTQADLNL